MEQPEIIKKLAESLNFEFNEVSSVRSIFFDLAEKEATYSLNNSNEIIGLKIKGFELQEIPDEITELKSLSVLNFSRNKFSDLNPLKSLFELTALNLDDNKISDLEPISNLLKIKWLNLQFNEISDINSAYKLKQLRKLYLDNNSINNISGISRLTYLTELSLVSNNIKDIKPLTYNNNLKKLDLSNNKIIDVSEIIKLTNLEELNISRNKITVVPDLRAIRTLVSFKVSYNKIKSTKVFEGLRCSIDANGNPIKDVYIFNEPQKGVLYIDGLTNITANILDQIVTEKGSMAGIFGKWGRGKTFFWKVLRTKMEQKNYQIVEFLAWKYHDTPASWAYLYEAFAKKYFNKPQNKFSLKWISYIIKIIITNFRREPILNFFRLIIGVFVPIMLYFGVKRNIDNFSGNFEFLDGLEFNIGFWGTYISVIGYYFSKIYSLNMPNIFKRISAKKFENLLGMQATIEKEFVFLFKTWKKKVILFVDDLDRCSEDHILNIIDSLRIMTENQIISENLTILAAIDERILKRVIKNKYKEMVEDDKQIIHNLTREYLDKLFLFGIKLSALSNEEKIDIFDNYTNNLQVLFGSLTYDMNDKNFDTEIQRVYREDFTFIRKYLKLVTEITPRQIRIIYNKYILANEILKLKSNQIELSNDQKEIIIALIMWFSIESKIEDLNSFFKNVTETEDKFTLKLFNKEFESSGKMWHKYIDIVRATVPY
ncbi:MAG: leucine-rich repeat domain-containing protein [Bacteroidales bacterium]|nr:leucine-rich repeat domain-containing protein [Bacteroidales bacterium]